MFLIYLQSKNLKDYTLILGGTRHMTVPQVFLKVKITKQEVINQEKLWANLGKTYV